MRHLWSLIAGIVVAPLAWGLLAMGQSGATATVEAWAKANQFDTADLIKPAAYLVAAGILLGLIATLRISPLGSMIAGLMYLAVNVGIFIDPFATRDAIPNTWSVSGQKIPLHTSMLNGTLLVVGVLLLVAVVSTGRWRAPAGAAVEGERAAGDATAAPAYAPESTYASAAPTYAASAGPAAPGPSAPTAEAAEPPAASWPPPATSGAATAPQPRHAGHDAAGAAPVRESPADPWDRAPGGDAGSSPSDEDRPESGDSPWSAPPRGGDRPE